MDINSVRERISSMHSYTAFTIGSVMQDYIIDRDYSRTSYLLQYNRHKQKFLFGEKFRYWLLIQTTKNRDYIKRFNSICEELSEIANNINSIQDKLTNLWKNRRKRMPEYNKYQQIKRLIWKLYDSGEVKQYFSHLAGRQLLFQSNEKR